MNLRRAVAVAALLVPALVLAAPSAHAQAARTGATRDHNEDLTLAVGETKTISARDVKNFVPDAWQGIIDVRLTPDGGQFVIV